MALVLPQRVSAIHMPQPRDMVTGCWGNYDNTSVCVCVCVCVEPNKTGGSILSLFVQVVGLNSWPINLTLRQCMSIIIRCETTCTQYACVCMCICFDRDWGAAFCL